MKLLANFNPVSQFGKLSQILVKKTPTGGPTLPPLMSLAILDLALMPIKLGDEITQKKTQDDLDKSNQSNKGTSHMNDSGNDSDGSHHGQGHVTCERCIQVYSCKVFVNCKNIIEGHRDNELL